MENDIFQNKIKIEFYNLVVYFNVNLTEDSWILESLHAFNFNSYQYMFVAHTDYLSWGAGTCM